MAPQLAPGLELIGEYEDSGFKETPYLARRADGQVLQLPRLLYDLAEQIDGRRDYDEIAARVTRAFGRGLTGNGARYLAEEKLVKVGQLAPKAHRADVELSHEKNPRQAQICEKVEITVRGKGPVIRAEARAEDPAAALDLAFGKLLERLRRHRDRRKVHHGRQTPRSWA